MGGRDGRLDCIIVPCSSTIADDGGSVLNLRVNHHLDVFEKSKGLTNNDPLLLFEHGGVLCSCIAYLLLVLIWRR